MRILYAVTTCSNAVYERLFAGVPNKPAFQSQKYHRLLIEGLAAHARVDVVANPPVNRSCLDKGFVRLPREQEGGAAYHNIPAIRNPVMKAAAVGFGTFFQVLARGGRDCAVVVDVLNRTTALAALLAARLRGRPCVGIVTDVPDLLSGSKTAKGISNFVIRHCTHYVFLTDAMNDLLNPKGKPWVLLEGHADITMAKEIPSKERKTSPRVCMYAGGVYRQYGLHNLVEGFRLADPADAQLVIYGPGDYVEELKAVAEQDERIHYGGMLLNREIVEREMEATLLINPRPTDEEYVRYSFPSKTMEYMSTGTPVLTTVLPGMPREYHPYVYLLEDETAQGIAETLRSVLSQTEDALFEKGQAARHFILNEKNNVIQAQKILDMLETR